MVGQLALLWHTAPLVLQCPSRGQSVLTKQADETTEHVPASVGHCALLVQTALLVLQLPDGGQLEANEHAAPLVLLLARSGGARRIERAGAAFIGAEIATGGIPVRSTGAGIGWDAHGHGQIANLGRDVIANLSGDIVASLRNDAVACLRGGVVAGLDTDVVAGLRRRAVADLADGVEARLALIITAGL